MKVTAALVIPLALFIALNGCNSAEAESRRGRADLRGKRHIVQKRLTADDVLGDMHTEAGLVNSCRETPPWGSCREIYDNVTLKISGFYRIHLPGIGKDLEYTVFCDMSTDVVNRPGGGWTVILRRMDSSLPSFNRTWEEYKNGFGCLNDSFWIGLKLLKHLVDHTLPDCSKTTYQLYVGMEATPSSQFRGASVFYNVFTIGNESTNYALNVNYSGGISSYNTSLTNLDDKGDALGSHSGVQFSTYDKDNDNYGGNCAQGGGGGWWYHSCIDSHLTGMYYDTFIMPSANHFDGIIWKGFSEAQESLKKAVMAIRPICEDE